MTEHEKRIREALACELTGEKWESDGAGVYSVGDSDFELAVCFTQDSGDAAYIAACNPSAIRALLADLDAMRADARRYAAFFTSGLPVCFEGKEHYSKADCDAAIDAALKGASHE